MTQQSLFDKNSVSMPVVHELPDSTLTEFPQAFSAKESAGYFARLRLELPWEQPEIRIAGRLLRIPRLQCWMGDQDSNYGYSGVKLRALPWTSSVDSIRKRVELLTGEAFNAVLVNFYRDGQDSVAWHSDNEPELGPEPVVASVSFGAERRFELRHKTRKELKKHTLILQDGSLLLMGKTTQNNWLHQIPKVFSKTGPRINLTFRHIFERSQKTTNKINNHGA